MEIKQDQIHLKTRKSDTVYQDTEKHRHECESRFVARKDDEWIIDHLEGVKEKRGFDAYKRLRDDVAILWKRK